MRQADAPALTVSCTYVQKAPAWPRTQVLYTDEAGHVHLLDPSSFDQLAVPPELFGEGRRWLAAVPELDVAVSFFQGEPVAGVSAWWGRGHRAGGTGWGAGVLVGWKSGPRTTWAVASDTRIR